MYTASPETTDGCLLRLLQIFSNNNMLIMLGHKKVMLAIKGYLCLRSLTRLKSMRFGLRTTYLLLDTFSFTFCRENASASAFLYLIILLYKYDADKLEIRQCIVRNGIGIRILKCFFFSKAKGVTGNLWIIVHHYITFSNFWLKDKRYG